MEALWQTAARLRREQAKKEEQADPVKYAERLMELTNSRLADEPGFENWLGANVLRPVQDLTGANYILPEVCNAAGKKSVTITALEAFITGYRKGSGRE